MIKVLYSSINNIIFFAFCFVALSRATGFFVSEPIATNSISFPDPQAKSTKVLRISKDFFISLPIGFQ